MAEKDYSHRSVVDKLGLKPGMRVRMTGDVGNELKSAAKTRIGGSLLRSGDLDVIVRAVRSVDEADEFVERVRPQLSGSAALWLVTRKKGDPRYIQQEELIPIGKAHDLVDNKVCSIDDTRSAMRFVIPKELRD
jgi:hypothetical protein